MKISVNVRNVISCNWASTYISVSLAIDSYSIDIGIYKVLQGYIYV